MAPWRRKSSNGRASHPAAFVRTLPTQLRAVLAMLILELFTFGGAGFADLRTHQADLFHKPRAAAHEGRSKPANLRAVMIQANTLFSRIHLAFLQTCSVAVIASSGTLDASVNTSLMLVVTHKNSTLVGLGQISVRPALQLTARPLVHGQRSLALLFPARGRPDSLQRRPRRGIARRE
jgi:hypothetical protein